MVFGEGDCFRDDTYFYFGKYSVDENYCERYWHSPEYINSFTAIFIIMFGLYQLCWQHNVTMLRFISASFIVNGICAFFNHWIANRIWFVMDASSIYIPGYIMFGLISEVFITRLNIKNISYQTMFKSIIWTLITCFMWFSLFKGMDGCFLGYTLDGILMIGPILFMFILTFIMKYCLKFDSFNSYNYNDKEISKKAFKYFIIGVISMLIGLMISVISESLCDSYHILSYIPFHPIWHILASYGLTLVMIYYIFLFNDQYLKQNVTFKTFKERHLYECMKWFHTIFPIIVIKENLQNQENASLIN